MNPNQTTLRPKLSLPLSLIAFASLVLMSSFSEASAQWTTPDINQNINNTNTGNVGIGTPAPGSLLEVKKSQNAATSVTIDNPFTTSGNSAFSSLSFKQNGVLRLHVASVNDNHSFITPGTAQFWNFANAPIVFANNNAETMRLSATGYLGIGTNSPGDRLVTIGNAVFGNITTHTQLYSTYDSQGNVTMEIGYGTATANITPLASLVLSKNLTSTNNGLGVISFANSNIANGNEKRLATISTWTDGALNSGALVFNTTLTGTVNERLRITSTGKIGVGTATPTAQFHIMTAAGDGDGLRIHRNGNMNGWGVAQFFVLNNSSNAATDYAQISGGIASNTAGTESGVLAFYTRNAGVLAEKMRIDNSGNVGIGNSSPTEKLHVNGNIKVIGNIDVTGNINAKYQDVAEWVESSQDLSAGTVVVLDATKNNQVVASTKSYDSRVAGVISLKPGIALGEQGEGHVLVATTGRVKVKVDASNGPIQIGDLLVTSDKTGVAMKSLPIDFAGAQIHRPGTLLGKALEPLAKGTGEILVLLSLQ